ncbi:hypothetical protein ACHAWF_016345 [Thalassiosira exigua]
MARSKFEGWVVETVAAGAVVVVVVVVGVVVVAVDSTGNEWIRCRWGGENLEGYREEEDRPPLKKSSDYDGTILFRTIIAGEQRYVAVDRPSNHCKPRFAMAPAPRYSWIISLIGPPGSGKGTYGALLAARLANASFLSVGDVLREQSAKDELLGEVLRSGALVDDALANDAVVRCLEDRSRAASSSSAGDVVVLDGFPRNYPQASLLSKWPTSLRPAFALQFDVPDDICITKLLGRRRCTICRGSFNVNGVDSDGFDMPPMLPKKGACEANCNRETDWEKRDDDTAETIAKRMEIYHQETKPVLNFWKDKGLLRFVPYNGVKDMDRLVPTVETYFDEMIRKKSQ